MKKILFSVVLALSFVACGGSDDDEPTDVNAGLPDDLSTESVAAANNLVGDWKNTCIDEDVDELEEKSSNVDVNFPSALNGDIQISNYSGIGCADANKTMFLNIDYKSTIGSTLSDPAGTTELDIEVETVGVTIYNEDEITSFNSNDLDNDFKCTNPWVLGEKKFITATECPGLVGSESPFPVVGEEIFIIFKASDSALQISFYGDSSEPDTAGETVATRKKTFGPEDSFTKN